MNNALRKTKKYLSFIKVLTTSEILTKYRESPLGPFWVIAANALLILGLYVVYSRILKSTAEGYFLYLSFGLVGWYSIVNSINGSANSLQQYQHLILNFKIPLWTYPITVVSTNFLLWLHNIPFLLLILIFNSKNLLLILPTILGALTGSIILLPFCIFFAAWCAKYKDLKQAITVIMNCLFFITPIVWYPSELTGRMALLTKLNPFTYILNLYRLGLKIDYSIFLNTTLLFLFSSILVLLLIPSRINPLVRSIVTKI